MASFLSLVTSSMATGIQGVTCVMVEAETLMHRGRGAPPAAARCLVDKHVLDMLSQGRTLTNIELALL